MDDEIEEAQKSRWIRVPIKPSAQEVEDHERLHLPFRDWCKHCVIGRGRNDPHFASKKDQVDGKPKLSWDYMYMHEETHEKGRPAVVKGEGLPIVIMHDSASKGILASAVPNKGDCEYAIKRATQDVTHILGYKQMIFKGDQEPALQTFMERTGMLCGDQVVQERSPVGESQSNGSVENAVLRIQGLYRTHRSALESKYGQRIPPEHPVLVWMVRFVSWIMFAYDVGSDGKPHTKG